MSLHQFQLDSTVRESTNINKGTSENVVTATGVNRVELRGILAILQLKK